MAYERIKIVFNKWTLKLRSSIVNTYRASYRIITASWLVPEVCWLIEIYVADVRVIPDIESGAVWFHRALPTTQHISWHAPLRRLVVQGYVAGRWVHVTERVPTVVLEDFERRIRHRETRQRQQNKQGWELHFYNDITLTMSILSSIRLLQIYNQQTIINRIWGQLGSSYKF